MLWKPTGHHTALLMNWSCPRLERFTSPWSALLCFCKGTGLCWIIVQHELHPHPHPRHAPSCEQLQFGATGHLRCDFAKLRIYTCACACQVCVCWVCFFVILPTILPTCRKISLVINIKQRDWGLLKFHRASLS